MIVPVKIVNYRLLVARKRQALSQKELAEKLGVSTRTVIRWERHRATPHPRHVRALCEFFCQTSEELGFFHVEDKE